MGCGGDGGRGSPVTPVNVTVNIVDRVHFAPALPEAPFNPRSERLAKADRQLTELLGHPVEFHFDAAVVPKWAPGFEDTFLEALEAIAMELGGMRDRDKDTFAWAKTRFARVDWDYDATKDHVSVEFQEPTGTLRIVLSPADYRVVPRGAPSYAVRSARSEALVARYIDLQPEAVAPAERRAYFRFLDDHAESALRARRPKTQTRDPLEETHFVTMERGARLALLLAASPDASGDGALLRDMDGWLASEGRHLADVYRSHGDAAARAAPGSDFRKAEAIWMKWFTGALPRLAPEKRADLVQSTQVRAVGASHEDAYVERAFPGFDFVEYALGAVDPWIRAGHPTHESAQSEEDRSRQRVFDVLLCPPTFRVGDERPYRCLNSDETLYRRVVRSRPLRERLVQDVMKRKDPAWARTVLVNLLTVHAPDDALLLWRATEADETLWRAVTRTVGATTEGSDGMPAARVIDEAGRIFRGSAARRGAGLYVLSSMAYRVHWDEFARQFGAPVDQATFVAFLAEDRNAVNRAPMIWPALGKGFSRMDVVVPRLDPYVDGLPDELRTPGQWGYLVEGLATRACTDGEGGKLLGYLEGRLRAHPSEEPALRTAVDTVRSCARKVAAVVDTRPRAGKGAVKGTVLETWDPHARPSGVPDVRAP